MAKSKYAHVIDKLPRYLGTEPGHQAKVDAVKRKMKEDQDFKPHGVYLTAEYAKYRAERDELKERMSELQVHIDAVDQMLVEQFEVEGVTTIVSDGGYSVRVQWEPYASVVDKELFRLWCIKNGFERQMQLPWATTNSHAKELLVLGEPEPDGVEIKKISKTFLTRER